MGGVGGDFREGKNKAHRQKCKCSVWVTVVLTTMGIQTKGN